MGCVYYAMREDVRHLVENHATLRFCTFILTFTLTHDYFVFTAGS